MIPLEELKKIASSNEECRWSEITYTWFVRDGYPKEPCRPECWYHPEYGNDSSEDDCVIYTIGSERFTHWDWSEYGKTWHCERMW